MELLVCMWDSKLQKLTSILMILDRTDWIGPINKKWSPREFLSFLSNCLQWDYPDFALKIWYWVSLETYFMLYGWKLKSKCILENRFLICSSLSCKLSRLFSKSRKLVSKLSVFNIWEKLLRRNCALST